MDAEYLQSCRELRLVSAGFTVHRQQPFETSDGSLGKWLSLEPVKQFNQVRLIFQGVKRWILQLCLPADISYLFSRLSVDYLRSVSASPGHPEISVEVGQS